MARPPVRRVMDCPSCGREVSTVTTTGPDEARVAPCGCEVTPAAVED